MTDKLLVAHNGQEALDLLQQHCQHATTECPALILLDIKMPVMDGFQFLEAYDQLPNLQKQVIVMLTTPLHPQDLDRVQKLNIAGFLSKPLTEEKINEVPANHFDRHLPGN